MIWKEVVTAKEIHDSSTKISKNIFKKILIGISIVIMVTFSLENFLWKSFRLRFTPLKGNISLYFSCKHEFNNFDCFGSLKSCLDGLTCDDGYVSFLENGHLGKVKLNKHLKKEFE